MQVHGPELIRFARRLVGDRHRGEDLVQAVLTRAARNWRQVRQAENLRAYLFTCVVNESLSWRRRLSNTELPHLRLIDDQPDQSELGPGFEQRHADRDALRQALSQLSPVQRSVLVLRYYLDLPDDQIAAQLGCSQSTVRSHAARALSRLRAAPLAATSTTALSHFGEGRQP